MATWPSALPNDPLKQAYEETFQDQTLRTKMDAGPDKVRRRFTAGARYFRMPLRLTKDQVEIYLTFWETTLSAGSLPFDWTHPRTKGAAEFMFMGPPKISDAGGNKFLADANMEILP
jgi:hypothetical protein